MACAQDVRIGVFGLFRPREITVKSAPGQALIVQTKTLQGEEKSFVLERSSGADTAEITASGGDLLLHTGKQSLRISDLHASSRGNGESDFVLAIPGKISPPVPRYARGQSRCRHSGSGCSDGSRNRRSIGRSSGKRAGYASRSIAGAGRGDAFLLRRGPGTPS